MKFVSTRTGIEVTSAESVFQGLAPDGGLFVPTLQGVEPIDCAAIRTMRDAEEAVMARLFDDMPAEVRTSAVDRLLSRFPRTTRSRSSTRTG